MIYCNTFISSPCSAIPVHPVNNILYNIVAAYNKQEMEQAKKEKREKHPETGTFQRNSRIPRCFQNPFILLPWF